MRGIPRRPRRSDGAAHAAESANRGAWVVGGGAVAVLVAVAVTAGLLLTSGNGTPTAPDHSLAGQAPGGEHRLDPARRLQCHHG